MKEFIEAAKQKPNQLKQSGGSVTARDAVVRQALMAETGAQWPFISFPSGGERIAALLGGHVDMMMIEPSEAREQVRSGKLRPLAQIGETPLEAYKDVPTLKEAGYPIRDVPQARGIVGPPNMPKDAVTYYEDLFRKASESAAWKRYLEDTQLQNAYLNSAELARFNKEYADTLRTILKEAGVKVNCRARQLSCLSCEDDKGPPEKSAATIELGRRGGRKRAETMAAEARADMATKAAESPRF